LLNVKLLVHHVTSRLYKVNMSVFFYQTLKNTPSKYVFSSAKCTFIHFSCRLFCSDSLCTLHLLTARTSTGRPKCDVRAQCCFASLQKREGLEFIRELQDADKCGNFVFMSRGLSFKFPLSASRTHLFPCFVYFFSGPGSSVGIATGYGLGGLGIESRWWRDFQHVSRPVLGPINPPVQWVPVLSRG